MGLPPGFRFHPTDDELVSYYLKRKVEGQQIELEVIPVIDLYKFDPWELPEKSFLPRRDLEWFFFCPRDRKYPNGSRTNRATASGYWKATGKDRKVICEFSVYGLRKTLVFYGGRAPGGERTDWMMHEYRLCEDFSQVSPNFLGAYALCRVVKRNEHGNKTSDVQDIPKAKRSHSSSSLSSFKPRKCHSKVSAGSEENQYLALHQFQRSIDSAAIYSPSADGRVTESQVVTAEDDPTSFWESNAICNASKAFSEKQGILSETTIPADFTNSAEPRTTFDLSPISSYVNLTLEAYLPSDLSCHACMSFFPSPAQSMGMYNKEENMDLTALEWNSQQFLNQPIYGTEAWNPVLPTICRQVSDMEEASVWLQEDNWVI